MALQVLTRAYVGIRVLSVFKTAPVEAQPRALVQVGGEPGPVLKQMYSAVVARTQHTLQAPLFLVSSQPQSL